MAECTDLNREIWRQDGRPVKDEKPNQLKTFTDDASTVSVNRRRHPDPDNDTQSTSEKTEVTAENDMPEPSKVDTSILYRISDSPSIILVVFFGLQQALLTVSGSIIAPVLVARAVCAENDTGLLMRLTSSTVLMNGVTTLIQTSVGVRLPVFQGPSTEYIVPLISLRDLDPSLCFQHLSNGTNATVQVQDELVNTRLRELMGPLMLAGLIHCLIGATGLVGLLMKFIGPVTIVPTILLIGIYLVKPTIGLAESHWGVTAFTWAFGSILTLYLGSHPMPIPCYRRRRGFYIIRFPLHQVFAILISILAGWSLSAILTYSEALPNDHNSKGYQARTDARASAISNAPWFYFPYPGQFGSPLFSPSALVGFLIATFTSILDSIGDYYATAAMCRVPPPPRHAVNRGIATEGFCTFLSGVVGCGHATSTNGGSIGAIGMTGVASRKVFYATGLIYVVLGVLGKVSGVFASIPYPVVGGAMVLIFSTFVGVNLSNLKVVDLTSTRNLSIIGIGVFVGLLIPTWMEKNGNVIDSGNTEVDQVIKILIGNPNLCGSVLSCLLDNTVPGTDEERGIAAWTDLAHQKENSNITFLEGSEVYDPLLPRRLLSSRLMKYIPIFPYKDPYPEGSEEIPK